METASGTDKAAEKPAFKVGVTLTKAQHRRFKMQCAANDETMQAALLNAIELYCTHLKRPPQSEAQKAEQRRVKRITDAIEAEATKFMHHGERVTAGALFERIRTASSANTKPSLADMVFLGQDRLKNALHQRAGTDRGFKYNQHDQSFELLPPRPGRAGRKVAAKPRRRDG